MMLDVNLSQIDSRIAMIERELGQANEELVRYLADWFIDLGHYC